MMGVSEIKEWLGIIAIIISVGATIYAWITARSQKNSTRLVGVQKKMVEYDRRIQSLESEFKHLPTHEQVSELRVAIAELTGVTNSTQATVSSTNNAVKRLEQNFLDYKKA